MRITSWGVSTLNHRGRSTCRVRGRRRLGRRVRNILPTLSSPETMPRKRNDHRTPSPCSLISDLVVAGSSRRGWRCGTMIVGGPRHGWLWARRWSRYETRAGAEQVHRPPAVSGSTRATTPGPSLENVLPVSASHGACRRLAGRSAGVRCCWGRSNFAVPEPQVPTCAVRLNPLRH